MIGHRRPPEERATVDGDVANDGGVGGSALQPECSGGDRGHAGVAVVSHQLQLSSAVDGETARAADAAVVTQAGGLVDGEGLAGGDGDVAAQGSAAGEVADRFAGIHIQGRGGGIGQGNRAVVRDRAASAEGERASADGGGAGVGVGAGEDPSAGATFCDSKAANCGAYTLDNALNFVIVGITATQGECAGSATSAFLANIESCRSKYQGARAVICNRSTASVGVCPDLKKAIAGISASRID